MSTSGAQHHFSCKHVIKAGGRKGFSLVSLVRKENLFLNYKRFYTLERTEEFLSLNPLLIKVMILS
jgi:hypothetical protein